MVYMEWRWGSILDVLDHWLLLTPSLSLLWGSNRFQRGVEARSKRLSPQEKEHDEEYARSTPIVVGEEIHNPRCWGLLHMMPMTSELLSILFSRVKQCPCHPASKLSSAELRFVYGGSLKAPFHCPLMDCVAPWLATGSWIPSVRSLQQSRERELLSKLVGLFGLGRKYTHGSFRKGCGALNTELALTLTFGTGTLPYVPSGCALDDLVDAKVCASKALQQWKGSVDKELEQSRTKIIMKDQKLYDELTELAFGEKPPSD